MQRKAKGPGVLEGLSRRSLLQLGVAGAALLGRESAAASDGGTAEVPPRTSLDESTLDALQARMASGEETSRSITQNYLDRIAQRDGRVRSVLETNPDALAQAEALDRERKAGKVRGPLHGVPVLLKDNIATKDRMHTTAGSLALMDATVAGGRIPGRTAARGGRSDARQDAGQRVGQLPLDPLVQRLERPRRPVPERLRARPEPLGLELGVRGGGLGEPVRGRRRHRDRRIHRLALGGLGPGRSEADGGAGEPRRHHPHLAQPGHGRPDGPYRPGRGAAPRGAGWTGPGGRRLRRQGSAVRCPLRRCARPGSAEGRAHRRAAAEVLRLPPGDGRAGGGGARSC